MGSKIINLFGGPGIGIIFGDVFHIYQYERV
jgi:hypothetical protein